MWLMCEILCTVCGCRCSLSVCECLLWRQFFCYYRFYLLVKPALPPFHFLPMCHYLFLLLSFSSTVFVHWGFFMPLALSVTLAASRKSWLFLNFSLFPPVHSPLPTNPLTHTHTPRPSHSVWAPSQTLQMLLLTGEGPAQQGNKSIQ